MIPRFVTDDGFEVPTVTAAQMREVDRIAIEETGPNLLQMMEHAGRSLALEVLRWLGAAWRTARVVVLAGTGGNGGGGICAARHLANRGVDVRLCLAGPLPPQSVTAFQQRIYLGAGGREIAPEVLPGERPALIVDALLGYNLRGAPREPAATLIRWAMGSAAPVLALDVPSGVDATSGDTPGIFVQASWTLTLALPKAGLDARWSGEIILADLGIPAAVFQKAGIPYVSPFGTCFRVPLHRA